MYFPLSQSEFPQSNQKRPFFRRPATKDAPTNQKRPSSRRPIRGLIEFILFTLDISEGRHRYSSGVSRWQSVDVAPAVAVLL